MSQRPARPVPVMLATLAVVLVAILGFGIYVARTVGGPTSSTTGTSPPASASASTSVSAAAPGASCSGLHFGPQLQPTPGDSGKRTFSAPPVIGINTTHHYLVTMKTTKGDIALCLDPQLAPLSVNNFVFLSRNGFYNGLTFHRIVADFVIQGGDPKGTGSGDPGYKFNDEPVKGQYTAGAVAMANSGANTNGSQFFICTVDDTAKLQKSYNLFGYVQTGMDVVIQISKVAVDSASRPLAPVIMTTVVVQEEIS
ncbi:MAG: peptidylprolyl isomerase [Candidatus Dormibacteraeota bacterium]|nr:peptidylprolyl isomerase [Candidatus Dormibacteraeota bacterium]